MVSGSLASIQVIFHFSRCGRLRYLVREGRGREGREGQKEGGKGERKGKRERKNDKNSKQEEEKNNFYKIT